MTPMSGTCFSCQPGMVWASRSRISWRKLPAYQRGLWHSSRASTDDNALAQKFFQRAVDLDPSFAGGYKGLAGARGNASDFHGRGLLEALSAALALARRAVALDGADAEARSRLAN